MCRSCVRKREQISCYVSEYVHWDSRGKPVLALKRYVDSRGRPVGEPVVVTYDVEYAKGLFPNCVRLDRWVSPRSSRFRVRWLEYIKAKSKLGGKRELSYQLSRAFELAKSSYSDEVLAEQSRLASSYCSEKAGKVVVLKRKDSDEVIGLPYPYRFSSNRVSRLKRYFREVVSPRIRLYDNFCFVTFTLDHTRFDTQYEAKAYALKKWNKVLTALKRKYSHDGKTWISVIRTTEWQSNGKGVHLHVLVCGLSFIPKDWLMRLWGENSGWSVELRSLRGNWKFALNYILKYIMKSAFRDGDEDLGVSQVVNWATLSRAYGLSHSLCSLGYAKHNSNGFWEFLGVVDLETYNSLDVGGLLRYFGRGVT